jgi:pimeloyl-ACP methyl ester carboxylesterase
VRSWIPSQYNQRNHLLTSKLAEVVANHLVNALVSRMRGHFDRSICAQGNRAGLLADTEVDFALAQKLGGEVVLMGHSTGALLLTWLAIRNPGKVARLILLSPAFGVHSLAQAGAWTAYLTRIDLVTADGEVSTGHSGLEVSRAARAFRAWLRANSRDGGLYTCHVPFNYENEFSYFQLLTSAINLIMGF